MLPLLKSLKNSMSLFPHLPMLHRLVFNYAQKHKCFILDLKEIRRIKQNMRLKTGKVISLQAWTGPEVSRRMRLLDLETFVTYRW